MFGGDINLFVELVCTYTINCFTSLEMFSTELLWKAACSRIHNIMNIDWCNICIYLPIRSNGKLCLSRLNFEVYSRREREKERQMQHLPWLLWQQMMCQTQKCSSYKWGCTLFAYFTCTGIYNNTYCSVIFYQYYVDFQ